MLLFIYVIISAAIGAVLGMAYNKLLLKNFSGGHKTVVCVLTLIIFIISAVSASVMVGIQSNVNSKIRVYSVKIEQYILNAYSDNEFVKNGIDITLINNGVLQVNNVISDLKTMIPSPEELNVNKKGYDIVVNYLTKELQNRIGAVDKQVAKGAVLVNKNGIITVSSILNLLTDMAVKQVNIISCEIIIVLMLPLIIYIAVTVIIVLVKAAHNKRKKAATVE